MSRLDPKQWAGDYYPDTAGFQKHSATSKAAADSINPKLGRLHQRVLDAFRAVNSRAKNGAGMTDEELQSYLGCLDGPTVWRPRRIELTAQGYLKDSGRTRTTASGRRATVWVLA